MRGDFVLVKRRQLRVQAPRRAAAARTRGRFARACSGFFAPGMIALTASKSRHQRTRNRHRHARRQRAASARRPAPRLSRTQAGECLADVELLAVAVEIAVVARGKRRRLRHLPAEQPPRQRQPHEQRDVPLFRLGEERGDRFLAENIED